MAAVGAGGAGGRFVGSEACRSCHASEYAAWSGSRHRSAMRIPAPGEKIALASAPSSPFRLDSDGAVEGPGENGGAVRGRVAFLLGGKHREDVVVRLEDGRLQVFPWSWDADRSAAFRPLEALAGGSSPPADAIDFWTRAGRSAPLACYGCHATGQTLTAAGKTPGGMTIPATRWIEPGVGCEGCHGPGGPHLEAARAKAATAGTMKLARADGSVDACAACHGLRDVLPSPFGDEPAHRYGAPLYEAADPLLTVPSNFEFHEPFFGDLRPATYQQEAVAFAQSGCARRGGLTCSGCHDVHSGTLRPDAGDSLCAKCHKAIADAGRGHTLHAPGSPGGRCIDCHMAAIVRGPASSSARDHSMAPPTASAGHIPAACASCHASGGKLDAIAAAWKKMPDGKAAAWRRGIGDAVDGAETDAGTDALLRAVSDDGNGWFVRWSALRRIVTASTPRRTEPMAEVLKRTLSDPNPALRREAARALGRFGRPQEFEALVKATNDPDPWTALAAAVALGRLGAPDTGTRFPEVLKRPDLVLDARAQFAYGHALLLARNWVRAESVLERALEMNPMMVGAISDLGLSLRAQGKRDQADAAWKTALEINPRFESARQNLEKGSSAASE
ncbi:MAG TPA: HEAT repeat domain-containing protein [Candidatus Polarisedimenticolaceae bacterium]|nr:HEAT repeat domain-containing protein [Candidatus Polarisedimenticolaceae bacterium]